MIRNSFFVFMLLVSVSCATGEATGDTSLAPIKEKKERIAYTNGAYVIKGRE